MTLDRISVVSIQFFVAFLLMTPAVGVAIYPALICLLVAAGSAGGSLLSAGR